MDTQEDNVLGAKMAENARTIGVPGSQPGGDMDPLDSDKGPQGVSNSSAVLGPCPTGRAR